MTEPSNSNSDHYVLVVDDDEDMRESIEAILSNYGHQVTGTCGGSEALAFLRSGRPLPCLILLDLMMPGMDGLRAPGADDRRPIPGQHTRGGRDRRRVAG